MDGLIEATLQPGRFIPYGAGYSFVSDLERVAEEIAKLVAAEPARAVTLYETFLAGCNAKADEIDDSDGEFGTFASGLFCGWIKARQAAGSDRDETAKLLLGWMDNDNYGFCNDLERSAVKVLDWAGLQAFEREVRARPNFERGRWGDVLKAIYSQQRNIEKYFDLTARTELTQADCEAIATMFLAKRKPNDALAWVERGLGIEKRNAFGSGASYKLGEMARPAGEAGPRPRSA